MGDLTGSCARAASAAEAAYRIDAPIAPARAVRIVALDPGAAAVALRAQDNNWVHAHFFVCEGVAAADTSTEGLILRGLDGAPAVLDDELDSADVVVMIATVDGGAESAHAIGKACWERGIQTAGLVVSDGSAALAAVAALRPHARVLLPSADETDVVELLTALRA